MIFFFFSNLVLEVRPVVLLGSVRGHCAVAGLHVGHLLLEAHVLRALFVFSINGPKQNARSLLTPVSDPTFYALSHGSKHFLLHGSSNNRLFQRF